MTLTPTIGIQGGFQLLTLRDASWIDDPRIQRLFPPSAWRPARAAARASRATRAGLADARRRSSRRRSSWWPRS